MWKSGSASAIDPILAEPRRHRASVVVPTLARVTEPQTEINLTGDQLSQLRAFVHDNRDELLATLDGLTEEQVRRRLVPSKTSLIGLVKHATFVEKVMFQVGLAGRTRAEVGVTDDVDPSFDVDDTDTIASVVATYRE